MPDQSVFVQSIQEVGGYVLIAMNDAEKVPLINLRLIRGQNLYESQYALLVMSNYNRNHSSATLNYTSGLKQLQLSSLTGTVQKSLTQSITVNQQGRGSSPADKKGL